MCWRSSQTPWADSAAARDADSEGVEGKYYVFTPEELRRNLGPEAEAFCRLVGVTGRGNFEGKSIPNLIGAPDWEAEPEG